MAISNIYSLMNIGKQSIISQQAGIQVTGHNIANVNTEGYTRQSVIMETTPASQSIMGGIGTGVRIAEIRRAYDNFLGSQLNIESAMLGKWGVKESTISRVEVLFNDTVGGGLNKSLSDFFNSWEELSLNSNSEALRQNVIGKGQILADSFNKINQDLERLVIDVDRTLIADISRINEISDSVAQLNGTIADSIDGDTNDLRDKRDILVREMSAMLDVTSYEQPDGNLLLATTGGHTLVTGKTAFQLQAQGTGENANLHNVMWRNIDGTLTNINSEINNGELGGVLEVRDEMIAGYREKLDRLAASLVQKINEQHQSGYSLDGSTGIDFFSPLSVTAKTYTTNSGSATIGANSVLAPESASLDRFELSFTSATTFTLNNLTTGVASGSYTFTSGSPIGALQLNGINLVINGSPAVGDKFLVSLQDSASSQISVSSTLNSSKVAAGGNDMDGDGSNALSIADLQREATMGSVTSSTASGATTFSQTFDDFYNSLVAIVGNDSATASENVQLREAIKLQVENRREQSSGVSLDEEMINLIKYQHAYSAAGKLISTVDEMLRDILNMVG